MKTIIVTPAKNVKLDDENRPLIDEEGMPELIDEDLLGMIVNTHTVNLSQFDPETQKTITGFVIRHEVIWENQRIPATSLVAPEDLAWVSIDEEKDDEDDGVDQDDDTVEDENYFDPVHGEEATSEDPDDEGQF